MVLNVGNSRLGIGVFVAGELQHTDRIAHEQRQDWPARLAHAWKMIEGKENAAVAGASVNPPMDADIARAVRQATGQAVEWVGKEIDLPIPVLTEVPAETGVDRVLNVAAAYEEVRGPCVVIDAGTALTINLCSEKGEFVGGTIAPGAGMQLDALHGGTAQLPEVKLATPDGAFGKNTRQAMLHGVFHGIRGMVREVIENYATELRSWPEVVATGGDAALLFEGWELVGGIVPDLTLYGIALAYAEHHIKHGS